MGDTVGKQSSCSICGLVCAPWDSHHILDVGKGTPSHHEALITCSHCILQPNFLLFASILIQFLPYGGQIVNDATPGLANKRCTVHVLGRQELEDVLSDDGETVLIEHRNEVFCNR